MGKIKNIEDVLRTIVAVAERVIGRVTTAITESLEKTIILDREEVDLSGGCGKLRLGVQYRGNQLIVRLALSAEAIAGGCQPIAERWASEAYQAVAELEPEALVVVAETNGDGHTIRQLWKIDKTGARAGI